MSVGMKDCKRKGKKEKMWKGGRNKIDMGDAK